MVVLIDNGWALGTFLSHVINWRMDLTAISFHPYLSENCIPNYSIDGVANKSS